MGRNAGCIVNSYAIGGIAIVQANLPPEIPSTRRLGIASSEAEASGGSGGGLVGVNEGMVTHCFWDTEAGGLPASDGGTGLPTARMMESRTFSLSGWGGDPS